MNDNDKELIYVQLYAAFTKRKEVPTKKKNFFQINARVRRSKINPIYINIIYIRINVKERN